VVYEFNIILEYKDAVMVSLYCAPVEAQMTEDTSNVSGRERGLDAWIPIHGSLPFNMGSNTVERLLALFPAIMSPI